MKMSLDLERKCLFFKQHILNNSNNGYSPNNDKCNIMDLTYELVDYEITYCFSNYSKLIHICEIYTLKLEDGFLIRDSKIY
jgi:hypothetical protein